MDELIAFESEFEKEITDLLVLTKTSTGGGAVVGDFIRPVVYLLLLSIYRPVNSLMNQVS